MVGRRLFAIGKKFGCPFALELFRKITISRKPLFFNAGRSRYTVSRSCGEGEIRTLDPVSQMPVFETGAFDHSATSPWSKTKTHYHFFRFYAIFHAIGPIV
jgi:hypothetical protein